MTYKLLDRISAPASLRKLSVDQLAELVDELRDFIIKVVSVKEGHLGASLGVVELTVALHYVFQTPTDKLVWDVGHQAYGHKIITGRKNVFNTNRQWGGISGFPKPSESIYDTFGVGHSSTSISAALGMAIAASLNHSSGKHHIAVIGDASIASGMAFEALNHSGVSNANFLVVLNDNAIGIDPSVGALKQNLTKLKKKTSKVENIFKALNFSYTGPIDGHNLSLLIKTLQQLKEIKGPKILHIITTKGKGLKKAEENQVHYHSPGKFDATTGELSAKKTEKLPPKFQDVFGHTIVALAERNSKIVGITPAMPTGSSLKYMMQAFPDRAFDVGIAEQHAVTLAAGMATQGLLPFCTIYSTFLQRAYDQIIHDVALQKLPVVFCIDRAGLVGHDGATHHGVFDIAYLQCIPNLHIVAPRNAVELRNILYTVQLGLDTPIAIRYPRGRSREIEWQLPFKKIPLGSGYMLKKGTDLAIISVGTMAYNVSDAILSLRDAIADRVGHASLMCIKPLDTVLLHHIFSTYKSVITVEEGVITGGVASAILAFVNQNNYSNKIIPLGIPDMFIEHGSSEELQDLVGISSKQIAKVVLQYFQQ